MSISVNDVFILYEGSSPKLISLVVKVDRSIVNTKTFRVGVQGSASEWEYVSVIESTLPERGFKYVKSTMDKWLECVLVNTMED